MRYAKINITTNEVLDYPLTLEYLVAAQEVASTEATSEELEAAGIVAVDPATQTQPTQDEYSKNLLPVKQSDGTWKEEWVRLPTTEEQKAYNTAKKSSAILSERQYLLDISDWTQLPDVTLSNKATWATYRQALRDIPVQTGYPWTVTWPTHPNNA